MSAVRPTPSWPQLGAGYGTAARTGAPGDALPWSTVEGWLRSARNYWLCTARSDGPPHAKPVWALWLDGAVVFSTSPSSVAARNLSADPRATVHLEGDHVAIVEGVVESTPFPEGFVAEYEAKYGWRVDASDPDTPLFALRARTVLSWDEAELAGTMVRWSFPAG
jgi:hypothetical protein